MPEGGYVAQRANEEWPAHYIRIDGGEAVAETVAVFGGSDNLAELKLAAITDQQMFEVMKSGRRQVSNWIEMESLR